MKDNTFCPDDFRTRLDLDEVTRHIVGEAARRRIDIAHDRNTWLAIGADLKCRYPEEQALGMFLEISAQYSDEQAQDPERVFRSLNTQGRFAASPGALINAAKRAGIDIVPPGEKARREEALRKRQGMAQGAGKGAKKCSPDALCSPNIFEDEQELDQAPVTFPKRVFEGLPSILQRIADLRVDPADGTMLLTTALCALSSLMTRKIYFRYSKRYRPNFLVFVIGTPASGKGRAALSEILLRGISDKMYARSMQARDRYENERLMWQKKDKKHAGAPPREPKMEILLLPVNSTSASLEWLLGDNDGCGFLSTSDGGEMAAAWAGEYGNYAVDMLKTVENEPIPRSRKTDKEVVSIREARFSAVIASTWEQVRKLFGNGRDGLFSRPVFVRMPTDTEWKNQWKEEGRLTDEEICRQIGADVFELDIQLQNMTGEKEFELGPLKKKEMNRFFRHKHRELCAVYGPDIAPSVRRMAVTAQRMMCVISVCREMYTTNGNPSPGPICCSDDDFRRVLDMVDVLLMHTAIQFCHMPKEDNASENVRSMKRVCFFKALRKEFDRKRALKTARKMEITVNRFNKYIRYFIDNKMIERTDVGKYRKLEK